MISRKDLLVIAVTTTLAASVVSCSNSYKDTGSTATSSSRSTAKEGKCGANKGEGKCGAKKGKKEGHCGSH